MRDYRPGPEKKMEALNVRNWQSKMDDWQTGSSLTQQGRLFKSSAAQGTPPLHGAEHIRWLYITPATHCIHIPFICPSIMEKGKQSKECEPKTRAMLSWIAGKKELRHTTKSLLNRSRLLCRKCFKCRQNADVETSGQRKVKHVQQLLRKGVQVEAVCLAVPGCSLN